MVLFKRLDRYLLRSFFTTLLVVGLATGLTIIVVNMVEELRDFIDHQVPLLNILEYYLYFGGWTLKSFFPFFVLLASLFSISLMARRNELLAMKASGLSLYRLALPYIIVAAFLSVGHFYYSEYIFPPANRKRLEIKEFTIERKSKEYFARARNIYRQVNPGTFYTISTFNITRREGKDFKFYKTKKSQLDEIITAKELIFEDNTWLAVDGVARFFDSTKQESYTQFDTLPVPEILEKPDDFARPIGNPNEMGLEDLKQYIDLMKRTGGPYLRESIDLQMKYSFPLTSLIVMFICIPFASNAKRSGIAVSIASGALIALVYFVLFRVSQSAGYNAKIPELVAVWGVNGLFLFVGMILMITAKK